MPCSAGSTAMRESHREGPLAADLQRSIGRSCPDPAACSVDGERRLLQRDCTASCSYDARDRSCREVNRTSITTGYTLYPVGSHGRLPSTVLRLRGRITAQQLASQTWSGRTVKFLYDACRPPRPCVRSTAGSDPGPRARSRRGRDARLFMAISGLPRSSRRLSGACARSGCQRPARLRRDARSRRRSHQSSTRPRSSRGLDEESRAGARRVANIPLPERVRRAPWAAGSAGHTLGGTMVDRRPRGGNVEKRSTRGVGADACR